MIYIGPYATQWALYCPIITQKPEQSRCRKTRISRSPPKSFSNNCSNMRKYQNSAISYNYFPQKYCKYYNTFSIDMSIFRLYYRGSFWIKLLSRGQKQTSIPKYNSTLHTEDPVFLAVTGSSLFYRKIHQKPPRWAFLVLKSGGAAGYCLRVRTTSGM